VLTTDPTGAVGEPHVYNQEYDEPRRGRAGWIIAAFVVVIAIAAGGFIAYRMVGEKKHTVPNLVGVAESVARNQIAEDNWIVAVTNQRSDTQPQGTIISTDPAAGASLKEGQTITFVVSGGPTLATLPEVAGKTVDEATALLTAAKLDIVVATQDFSEVVPAGTIISWMVPAQAGLTAGMQVTQRTVVAVDVSKGPAPRTVPNLVGTDIATATKTLNDLGLLILRDPADVFSPTVPVGQIAAQSVAAGAKANRGDTITVAVSKGVENLPVPSLANLTLDQIKSTLVGAGFVIGKISGPSTTGLLARVSTGGADVTLGELLPRNSVLDLEFIAPPPPPTAAPTTAPVPPAT